MRQFIAGTIGLMILLSALPAHAVIVAGGDGTQNVVTTLSPFPFQNVGRRGNSGSGIYLGDGVVLTAWHVGAGTIELGGTPYTMVSGSAQRLVDPNNPNSPGNATDLILYRINGDPLLPSLAISTSTPAVGTAGTLVGNGSDRDPVQYFWNVESNVWTEQPTAAGAEASGYKWVAAVNDVRFGSNETVDASVVGAPAGPTRDVDTGGGRGLVRSLITVFDAEAGEGQGASGDSGGAFFAADGTLIGMMHAIGSFTGQPASTSVFGNVTYSADIAHYSDQIIAYIPEPSAAVIISNIAGLTLLRRRNRAA